MTMRFSAMLKITDDNPVIKSILLNSPVIFFIAEFLCNLNSLYSLSEIIRVPNFNKKSFIFLLIFSIISLI